MRPWAIFTDLDGTLLDADDFSFEPARIILVRLLEAGVPVVPITSKTTAEVLALTEELDLPGPIVIESGGGILRHSRGAWLEEPQRIDPTFLRGAASIIEERTGCRLELFSEMNDERATEVSGLSGRALIRAKDRRFDQPFLAPTTSLGLITRAAAELGLSVRRGGRFQHLCGPANKGHALTKIRTEITYATGDEPIVVGLGDSPLDAEFLLHSNIPIIIPRPNGKPDPDLVRAVPYARIAPAAGPRGWSKAVRSVWAMLRSLPSFEESPPLGAEES